MLVVGTRGRSLGGIQSLVNTRNSFSKYCLQYSPVPVVVVRPTEKRNKKKERRAADSTRQTYQRMLAANNGKHEADSDTASSYDLEVQISADEEAHQVAKVLGLPASFDPTIKPLASTAAGRQRRAGPLSSTSPLVATSSAATNADNGDNGQATDKPKAAAEGAEQQQPGLVVVPGDGDGDADDERASIPAIDAGNSDSSDNDDDDDEDGEGEFEVMDGKQALDQEKLEQLHKMEVGEAAALRMKMDEEEDDDDDDDDEEGS